MNKPSAMIISTTTVGENPETFLDVPTNQAKLSSMAETSIASVAKRTSFVSYLTTTKRKLHLRSVTPTFSFSKTKSNLNASNDAPPSNSYTKNTHTPNLTNVSTSPFAESNQTLNLTNVSSTSPFATINLTDSPAPRMDGSTFTILISSAELHDCNFLLLLAPPLVLALFFSV